VLTARITDARGELVGALMVHPDDEVFAITSSGGVIRTSAGEVKMSGRQTMGVRLMNLGAGDSVVAIARNAESLADAEADAEADDEADDEAGAGADTGDAGPEQPGDDSGAAG
jgi:DNA gyrase subunit A